MFSLLLLHCEFPISFSPSPLSVSLIKTIWCVCVCPAGIQRLILKSIQSPAEIEISISAHIAYTHLQTHKTLHVYVCEFLNAFKLENIYLVEEYALSTKQNLAGN